MSDKSPYDRIQWFHTQTAKGCYPNAEQLSRQFGISLRQAFRDINCFRERFGAPIEYNRRRHGYYYIRAYALPVYYLNSNEADFLRFIDEAGTAMMKDEGENGGRKGNVSDLDADSSFIQLQIPYTALIELPEKRTFSLIDRFVVADEGPGRYRCEFNNVDFFLAALMSSGGDFRVVEPLWLRSRLVELAENSIKCNTDQA